MPAQEPLVSAREIFGVEIWNLLMGLWHCYNLRWESGRDVKDGNGVQRWVVMMSRRQQASWDWFIISCIPPWAIENMQSPHSLHRDVLKWSEQERQEADWSELWMKTSLSGRDSSESITVTRHLSRPAVPSEKNILHLGRHIRSTTEDRREYSLRMQAFGTYIWVYTCLLWSAVRGRTIFEMPRSSGESVRRCGSLRIQIGSLRNIL